MLTTDISTLRANAQTPLIRFSVDLLYNKFCNKSTTNRNVVQQIHNISTCCASTTNQQQIEAMEFGFDLLWTCRGLAANHSELLYHVRTTCTSLYVIVKMDVIDENVINKQFLQLSTASLTDAYHNEVTLWDSNVNATEENELAWFRLSFTFTDYYVLVADGLFLFFIFIFFYFYFLFFIFFCFFCFHCFSPVLLF